MDDLGVGRLIMLARQRRQWRQTDLADAAGVSQQLVSLAESGSLERLSMRALRKIAAPLEIRMPFGPLWNGGEADRLRDRDHATLVEQVTTILRRHAWVVIVEYTFSHFGERGSIDLVGWHPVARSLLVVEVKTRIYDVQALVAGIDRKARLARQLLPAERGWRPAVVARVVVVPERSANRSLTSRHSQLFQRRCRSAVGSSARGFAGPSARCPASGSSHPPPGLVESRFRSGASEYACMRAGPPRNKTHAAPTWLVAK